PGSNAYDKQRARLRDLVEQSGRATDKEANQVANRILQDDRGQRTTKIRGERTKKPKDNREPGDPK
ncbi:hypothetical protein, partial [Micromonospora sp. M42]|uniref:hypothetical protein n=1 Tax=Micromonospora sp. M42 TaxID=457406 RepID=UPI0005B975A2